MMNDALSKKQYDGEKIDEDEYEYITVPPDGGYGWVITFAAMVVSISSHRY